MRPRRAVAATLAGLLLPAIAACGDDAGVSLGQSILASSTTAATTTAPDTTVARTTSTTTAPTTTAGAGTTSTTTGEPGTTVTSPDTTTTTTGEPVPAPDPIQWQPCGQDLDCATLTAPYDYGDASKGSFQLSVVRAPATDASKRIGSLLVNPGGPGFGGSYLAYAADGIYTKALREHFDIVAWDPRGTGNSTPFVDCIDTYDEFFALDPTPDDDAEQQALVDAAKRFDEACAAKDMDFLPYISTANTARDMDRIRQALGEDKISYFGFSYGSELGATWATLFPETVRATVLDGALDPNEEGIAGSLDQAKGFEIALNAFLDDCKKCDFVQGGDPGAAFDQIMADIDAHEYPTQPGRPALNQGIAYTAVIEAMYSESDWPVLANALDDARNGDGAGLLALYDDYYERQGDGVYGNELEAFFAISCLDDPGPQSVEEVDSFNAEFIAVAPHIGPSFTHGYTCVFWPTQPAPKLHIDAKGAGPVIVIGTTNDPATPFESSQRVADTLEGGIFVKVTGNGHLGYSQSPCAQDIVDKYLVDLQPPDGDVSCD